VSREHRRRRQRRVDVASTAWRVGDSLDLAAMAIEQPSRRRRRRRVDGSTDGSCGRHRRVKKDAAPRVGIVHVHQRGRISPANPIVVNFGTGPARPDVAHLPEVVARVEG
jgi:hypothetical protein